MSVSSVPGIITNGKLTNNIDGQGFNITGLGQLQSQSMVGVVTQVSGSTYSLANAFGFSAGQIWLITDAKTTNCSDGTCSLGANVTAGGGSLKRLCYYNGTNLVIIGV